ncbi:hypothetical protein BDZ89DRAFT_1072754 [Hymenopellis radicata]|nr:hypothetical protein BDZ89DRAFT_1072754 [Hymenopellis radicata]
MDLPGGDAFIDVGDLFLSASAGMQPGEMVWTDGFTLQDAMSALEIGEPRLDSGMVSGPPFDPLTLLLPQELCWIIDRSFAYEMEWHAGNLLSNTVFTLVHVHEIAQLDPDLIPYNSADKARPVELLSIVLKTYVIGLLKCCGVAWDALNRADKAEVSLLEGYPVQNALGKLDDALNWISHTPKLPKQWKDALYARINLRKILLQLMNTNLFADLAYFQALVFQARDTLQYLREHPAATPPPSSPAHLAFDPYIARRLICFIPIRVLTLPPMEETWRALELMLDGWHEMSLLSVSRNVSTWEIIGNLRLWRQTDRAAYIRERTQTCFYDGLHVLGHFTPTSWSTNAFVMETLGVSYDTICDMVVRHLERQISKVLISTITGCWYNAPRRRRQLMQLALEWHTVYDTSLVMLKNIEDPRPKILDQLPNAILLCRLSALRELVLSGFQLELYAANERPFAYWYASQIIEKHLVCIDAILSVIVTDSHSMKELSFQRQFLTAIQLLCLAMYSVLAPSLPFDWGQMKHNFQRRYKWVFNPKYKDVVAAPVGHPELIRFLPALDEITKDEVYSPAATCELAYEILSGLVGSGNAGGWAGFAAQERVQFVESFLRTSDNLRQNLPASVPTSDSFNWKSLKWDPSRDPWFPILEFTDQSVDPLRSVIDLTALVPLGGRQVVFRRTVIEFLRSSLDGGHGNVWIQLSSKQHTISNGVSERVVPAQVEAVGVMCRDVREDVVALHCCEYLSVRNL